MPLASPSRSKLGANFVSASSLHTAPCDRALADRLLIALGRPAGGAACTGARGGCRRFLLLCGMGAGPPGLSLEQPGGRGQKPSVASERQPGRCDQCSASCLQRCDQCSTSCLQRCRHHVARVYSELRGIPALPPSRGRDGGASACGKRWRGTSSGGR